jgi:hypothetical protein
VADPASLMSDLLGAAWMTLINAAGFIAANMRRSGVMQGRFELSVNARLALTIVVQSRSPAATGDSPIRRIG